MIATRSLLSLRCLWSSSGCVGIDETFGCFNTPHGCYPTSGLLPTWMLPSLMDVIPPLTCYPLPAWWMATAAAKYFGLFWANSLVYTLLMRHILFESVLIHRSLLAFFGPKKRRFSDKSEHRSLISDPSPGLSDANINVRH